MLGRLFKQNPHTNSANQAQGSCGNSNGYGGSLSHPKQGHSQGPGNNLFEDPYTREILYGTSESEQLRPYVLKNKFFRLIVAQDGGNLRSKQILLDTSTQNGDYPMVNNKFPTTQRGGDNGQINRHIMTSKVYHFANELTDYMFGCGLPTNETVSSTKLHLLPIINNLLYGSNQSVMITRLFLIGDSLDSYSNTNCKLWMPHSAIPLKEYGLNNNVTEVQGAEMVESEGNSSMCRKTTNDVNSRFAIGIIIPLESVESDISEVIFENWEEISRFLQLLQKLIFKKLFALLHNNANDHRLRPLSLPVSNHLNGTICSSYIVNRRVQFPSYFFQHDNDLNSQLSKLVKLINFNSNIPKLVNSNSIIRTSLIHPDSKFKPLLLNWVLELLNWFELKDGRCHASTQPLHGCGSSSNNMFLHDSFSLSPTVESSNNTHLSGDLSPKNTFLASLIALLIPLRDLLKTKPLSVSRNDTEKELTRVVVMTGNPVVARKLIFIINALIQDEEFFRDLMDKENVSNLSEGYRESDSQAHGPESTSDDEYEQEKTLYSPERTAPLEKMRMKDNIISSAYPSSIMPIPIKSTSTDYSEESYRCSVMKKSLSQLWDPPRKSTTSAATLLVEPRVETSTNTIPIKGRPRNELSSSMAYLSSSLNSSQSSSASNYSLSKLGSTFMDKWKNSFNLSGANGSSYNSHGPSSNDYQDCYQFPHSLSKRESLNSFRTPSPLVEGDEPFFNNGSIDNSGYSSTSVGTSTARLSRTQSMFDLYNAAGSSHNNHHGEKTIMGSKHLEPGIKRTKSAVYIPIKHDDDRTNVLNFNRDVIKKKCAYLMKTTLNVIKKDDILFVASPNSETSSRHSTVKGTDSSSKTASLIKKKRLNPIVAFSDEFRPEFTVQSCPLNPKLETQIIGTLKNDVKFYQSCGYSKITSRCIFISLRVREIKVIKSILEDKSQVSNDESFTSVSNASSDDLSSHADAHPDCLSPISSNRQFYFGSNNNQSNPFIKTAMKKMYTSSKNYGDKEFTDKIEKILNQMDDLFLKYYNRTDKQKGQLEKGLNERFSQLIHSILN